MLKHSNNTSQRKNIFFYRHAIWKFMCRHMSWGINSNMFDTKRAHHCSSQFTDCPTHACLAFNFVAVPVSLCKRPFQISFTAERLWKIPWCSMKNHNRPDIKSWYTQKFDIRWFTLGTKKNTHSHYLVGIQCDLICLGVSYKNGAKQKYPTGAQASKKHLQ